LCCQGNTCGQVRLALRFISGHEGLSSGHHRIVDSSVIENCYGPLAVSKMFSEGTEEDWADTHFITRMLHSTDSQDLNLGAKAKMDELSLAAVYRLGPALCPGV
jgi:hypothetical protein